MSDRELSKMSDDAAEKIVGGAPPSINVNNAPCDYCSCTRMFTGCTCTGHNHHHTVP